MSNETLTEAKKLIAEALRVPVSSISDVSTIDAHGKFDSLSFEKLILATEKFLGTEVKVGRLLDLTTIQDLADFIEEAKRNK